MLRNFLVVSGGNLARQFATFVAQIVVAHRVGEAAFGTFTYAFSIFLLIAGIADFGSRLYCWAATAALPAAERAAQANEFLWRRIAFAIIMLVPINLGILVLTQGELESLLHVYSLSAIANQSAFDWWLGA